MRSYESDKIRVNFDGKRCIHARRCVLNLPSVFQIEGGKDWVQPDAAPVEDLVALIESCPSGALTYERLDGEGAETPAPVNTARLWENGPVEVRGEITMPDGETRNRVLLCRCGQSKRKPYCDNSHLEAGFEATGDVESNPEAEMLEERSGPLSVKTMANGPVMIKGPLEVIAGSGRQINTGTSAVLCRCGQSKNKPYCDGSHREAGFVAD